MKQFVIATVVGAVIAFVLQAAQWMVLPIHNDAMRYTPAQDSILAELHRFNVPEGAYVVPNLPMEGQKDNAAVEAFHKSCEGKPWAFVTYHHNWSMAMGRSMTVGILLNLLTIALIVWLLGLAGDRLGSFGARFGAVLAIFAIIQMQGELMNLNWWETPWHLVKGNLIGNLLTWGGVGLWLGWYLGRK